MPDLRWTKTAQLFLLPLSMAAVACSGDVDDAALDAGGDDGFGSGVDEGASGEGGAADSAGGTGGGSEPWGTGGDDGGADDGDEPDAEEPDEETGTTGEVACDAEMPVTLFLSPDDSNSMSSPVQVREAVMSGWGSISSIPIRTWEFLNYYGFDYPAAQAGDVIVTPSLARDPEAPEGEYTLQIGVSSEVISTEDRAPMNVTFVLDTSGSMGGHPMDMLKETCRAIAASLKEGDRVSMVTWNTENAVVLGGYEVSGPEDPMLTSRIDQLEAGGGTDLHGGLVAGYELANQVFSADRINRMVLISDGGANAGVTDIELISQEAGTSGEDGIYMVGVGVGSASSYHDDLMDSVTDAGKGASVFINESSEAWNVFNERFISTMAVAARDVQVRLDLPPGFEIVKFSGEEYSGDPSEVEPQHLAPNDAMVFHQSIATCAPELIDEATTITVAASYKDAVTFEDREVETTLSFDELLAADQSMLLKGAAIFEYAEALKAHKRGEPDALAAALSAVGAAREALPEDADLVEIQMILDRM